MTECRKENIQNQWSSYKTGAVHISKSGYKFANYQNERVLNWTCLAANQRENHFMTVFDKIVPYFDYFYEFPSKKNGLLYIIDNLPAEVLII